MGDPDKTTLAYKINTVKLVHMPSLGSVDFEDVNDLEKLCTSRGGGGQQCKDRPARCVRGLNVAHIHGFRGNRRIGALAYILR